MEANGHAPEDSQWARTGWAPRFGQGNPQDDEGPTLLEHQTFLETKIEDKWFGGQHDVPGASRPLLIVASRLVLQCWYHNILMSRDLRKHHSWGRHGLTLYNHGFLCDILPDISTTGAAEF